MKESLNIDINAAADYICLKGIEAEGGFSVLKVQKLLYYVQAWHLALYNQPFFNDSFQAWVHGPVCRTIYDRFRGKSMYSTILESDISNRNGEGLDEHARGHIDSVLEAYASLTDFQLEELTHREDPWITARGGIPALSRCEQVIDQDLMATFYKKRLAA